MKKINYKKTKRRNWKHGIIAITLLTMMLLSGVFPLVSWKVKERPTPPWYDPELADFLYEVDVDQTSYPFNAYNESYIICNIQNTAYTTFTFNGSSYNVSYGINYFPIDFGETNQSYTFQISQDDANNDVFDWISIQPLFIKEDEIDLSLSSTTDISIWAGGIISILVQPNFSYNCLYLEINGDPINEQYTNYEIYPELDSQYLIAMTTDDSSYLQYDVFLEPQQHSIKFKGNGSLEYKIISSYDWDNDYIDDSEEVQKMELSSYVFDPIIPIVWGYYEVGGISTYVGNYSGMPFQYRFYIPEEYNKDKYVSMIIKSGTIENIWIDGEVWEKDTNYSTRLTEKVIEVPLKLFDYGWHIIEYDFVSFEIIDVSFLIDGLSIFTRKMSRLEDIDGDGVKNTQESILGMNEFSQDSDQDGLPDGTDLSPVVGIVLNKTHINRFLLPHTNDKNTFISMSIKRIDNEYYTEETKLWTDSSGNKLEVSIVPILRLFGNSSISDSELSTIWGKSVETYNFTYSTDTNEDPIAGTNDIESEISIITPKICNNSYIYDILYERDHEAKDDDVINFRFDVMWGVFKHHYNEKIELLHFYDFEDDIILQSLSMKEIGNMSYIMASPDSYIEDEMLYRLVQNEELGSFSDFYVEDDVISYGNIDVIDLDDQLISDRDSNPISTDDNGNINETEVIYISGNITFADLLLKYADKRQYELSDKDIPSIIKHNAEYESFFSIKSTNPISEEDIFEIEINDNEEIKELYKISYDNFGLDENVEKKAFLNDFPIHMNKVSFDDNEILDIKTVSGQHISIDNIPYSIDEVDSDRIVFNNISIIEKFSSSLSLDFDYENDQYKEIIDSRLFMIPFSNFIFLKGAGETLSLADELIELSTKTFISKLSYMDITVSMILNIKYRLLCLPNEMADFSSVYGEIMFRKTTSKMDDMLVDDLLHELGYDIEKSFEKNAWDYRAIATRWDKFYTESVQETRKYYRLLLEESYGKEGITEPVLSPIAHASSQDFHRYLSYLYSNSWESLYPLRYPKYVFNDVAKHFGMVSHFYEGFITDMKYIPHLQDFPYFSKFWELTETAFSRSTELTIKVEALRYLKDILDDAQGYFGKCLRRLDRDLVLLDNVYLSQELGESDVLSALGMELSDMNKMTLQHETLVHFYLSEEMEKYLDLVYNGIDLELDLRGKHSKVLNNMHRSKWWRIRNSGSLKFMAAGVIAGAAGSFILITTIFDLINMSSVNCSIGTFVFRWASGITQIIFASTLIMMSISFFRYAYKAYKIFPDTFQKTLKSVFSSFSIPLDVLSIVFSVLDYISAINQIGQYSESTRIIKLTLLTVRLASMIIPDLISIGAAAYAMATGMSMCMIGIWAGVIGLAVTVGWIIWDMIYAYITEDPKPTPDPGEGSVEISDDPDDTYIEFPEADIKRHGSLEVGDNLGFAMRIDNTGDRNAWWNYGININNEVWHGFSGDAGIWTDEGYEPDEYDEMYVDNDIENTSTSIEFAINLLIALDFDDDDERDTEEKVYDNITTFSINMPVLDSSISNFADDLSDYDKPDRYDDLISQYEEVKNTYEHKEKKDLLSKLKNRVAYDFLNDTIGQDPSDWYSNEYNLNEFEKVLLPTADNPASDEWTHTTSPMDDYYTEIGDDDLITQTYIGYSDFEDDYNNLIFDFENFDIPYGYSTDEVHVKFYANEIEEFEGRDPKFSISYNHGSSWDDYSPEVDLDENDPHWYYINWDTEEDDFDGLEVKIRAPNMIGYHAFVKIYALYVLIEYSKDIDTTKQEIVSDKDGHSKPMLIEVMGDNAYANFFTFYGETHDSGTVEFCIMKDKIARICVDTFFYIEENGTITNIYGDVIRGNDLFINNEWNHVKVSYTSDDYCDIWINGIKIVDDEECYPGPHGGFSIQLRKGYSEWPEALTEMYVDAIDFSWESGYYDGRSLAWDYTLDDIEYYEDLYDDLTVECDISTDLSKSIVEMDLDTDEAIFDFELNMEGNIDPMICDVYLEVLEEFTLNTSYIELYIGSGSPSDIEFKVSANNSFQYAGIYYVSMNITYNDETIYYEDIPFRIPLDEDLTIVQTNLEFEDDEISLPETYSFDSDTDGWFKESGDGTVSRESSYEEHNGVLCIEGEDTGSCTIGEVSINDMNNGSIAFYFASDDLHYSDLYINDGTTSKSITLRLNPISHEVTYHDGTDWKKLNIDDFSINTWYYLKISWDCDNYWTLEWDGELIKQQNADSFLDFKGTPDYMDRIQINVFSWNVQVYLDSVYYSWDDMECFTKKHQGYVTIHEEDIILVEFSKDSYSEVIVEFSSSGDTPTTYTLTPRGSLNGFQYSTIIAESTFSFEQIKFKSTENYLIVYGISIIDADISENQVFNPMNITNMGNVPEFFTFDFHGIPFDNIDIDDIDFGEFINETLYVSVLPNTTLEVDFDIQIEAPDTEGLDWRGYTCIESGTNNIESFYVDNLDVIRNNAYIISPANTTLYFYGKPITHKNMEFKLDFLFDEDSELIGSSYSLDGGDYINSEDGNNISIINDNGEILSEGVHTIKLQLLIYTGGSPAHYYTDTRYFTINYAWLNMTYPENRTYNTVEGYYPGTYSFDSEIGETDYDISIIKNLYSGAHAEVIEEFDNHKSILNMSWEADSQYDKLVYQYVSETSGILEFWLKRDGGTTYQLQLVDETNDYGICMTVGSTYLRFYYDPYSSYDTYVVNTANWNHISFSFDYSTNKVSAWVNGFLAMDDRTFYPVGSYLKKIRWQVNNVNAGSLCIDAIGYSWDINYMVGDNLYDGYYKDGHYPASYSFENEIDTTTDTSINFIDACTSNSLSIVSEYEEHKKVMKLDYDGSHYWYDYWYSEKVTGTIEFWVNQISGKTYMRVRDGTGDFIIYVQIRDTAILFIYGDGEGGHIYESYNYVGGWIHIKIEFDCTTGTWSGWANGTSVITDENFYDDNSVNTVDRFNCYYGSATEMYFDAIGYSWDTNYSIGDNEEEGMFVSFDTSSVPSLIKYSLNNEWIDIEGNHTFLIPSDGVYKFCVYANDSQGVYSIERQFTISSIQLLTPQSKEYNKVSEGYYPATYGFEDEEDETSEENIRFVDEATGLGNHHLKVVSDYLGHNKVLEFYDGGSYGNHAGLKHNITNTYGTIEFWWCTSQATYEQRVFIYSEEGAEFGVRIDDDKWKALTVENVIDIDGAPTPLDNTWYHIKIDFEFTAGGYLELNQHDFRINIDGTQYGDYGMFHCDDAPISIYTSTTGGPDANYYMYQDAWSFSWDENYNIGGNEEEGLIIKFESDIEFSELAYSLDDCINITIYGDFVIVIPNDGIHTIQIFGKDSNGKQYISEKRYFIVDID